MMAQQGDWEASRGSRRRTIDNGTSNSQGLFGMAFTEIFLFIVERQHYFLATIINLAYLTPSLLQILRHLSLSWDSRIAHQSRNEWCDGQYNLLDSSCVVSMTSRVWDKTYRWIWAWNCSWLSLRKVLVCKLFLFCHDDYKDIRTPSNEATFWRELLGQRQGCEQLGWCFASPMRKTWWKSCLRNGV